MKKLISIIIPVHNESGNIPIIYESLVRISDRLSDKYNCEIIFIDDGSTDDSARVIEKISGADSRVKYIELTRNFGKEVALTAGIKNCRGDACLMLDADLQHPVELIPEFIEKWEKGAETVVGIRKKYRKEELIKRMGSALFYKIINRIAAIPITPDTTDFRLLDKAVIDAFNNLTERNRMSRALIDWLGFSREYIYFEARERRHGQASYTFLKLLRLAMNSFVALSIFPLKIAGYLGLVITAFSGLLGLFIIIEDFVLNDPLRLNFSGPVMLAVFVTFLVGVVLTCLGLIALYIAGIHAEVVNRPLYVIRRKNT
ncbi:MAG: glycosyltransferase family 2 protein [PVC group bacterium]